MTKARQFMISFNLFTLAIAGVVYYAAAHPDKTDWKQAVHENNRKLAEAQDAKAKCTLEVWDQSNIDKKMAGGCMTVFHTYKTKDFEISQSMTKLP